MQQNPLKACLCLCSRATVCHVVCRCSFCSTRLLDATVISCLLYCAMLCWVSAATTITCLWCTSASNDRISWRLTVLQSTAFHWMSSQMMKPVTSLWHQAKIHTVRWWGMSICAQPAQTLWQSESLYAVSCQHGQETAAWLKLLKSVTCLTSRSCSETSQNKAFHDMSNCSCHYTFLWIWAHSIISSIVIW